MNERGLFSYEGFAPADVKTRRQAPPAPPPRDPGGINNILKDHVGAGGREAALPQFPSAERRRGGRTLAALRSDDDSDSSGSSGAYPAAASYRGLSMEDRRSNLRTSPLRAVVTPTTVDRARCSTYDNVDDASRREHASKPPLASRSSRVVTPTGDSYESNHLVAPRYLPRPSPVSFASSAYHPDSCPAALRASPASCRSAAQSPSRSGRSTPVRTRPSDASGSPWRELDQQQDGGDTTDSDPVRRRSSSGCRASRSHRGSVPPGGDLWHHGACSPCHPNTMRCHWHGAVPPYQTSCGCYGGGYMVHGASVQNRSCEDLEQKIFQLESEKEHLMLQASVLGEQVEAQNEKIKELESTLFHNKEELCRSEAMLKQEMDSRCSLENIKVDLITQVSSLRIKLATAERERQELEEKSSKLENELVLACACLAEKEADLASLKSKLPSSGKMNAMLDANPEIEKLKNALSSVISANDEKEKKIQELTTTLNRYKKLQELVLSNHSRRGSDGSSSSGYARGTMEDIGSLDPIVELNGVMNLSLEGKLSEKPPCVPRSSQSPLATSSPLHDSQHILSVREVESLRCSPVLSSTCHSLPANFSTSLTQRARSSDNVSPASQKTPPAKRHYGTMPRHHGTDVLLQIHQQLQQHKLDSSLNTSSLERNFGKRVSQSSQSLHHPGLETFRPPRGKTSGISFGKGFFRLRSGKRSSSAPELVQSEHAGTLKPSENSFSSHTSTRKSLAVAPNVKEKPRGIRKIFGRLKRTSSENLDNNAAEFKRGGIRATAGPRLGWASEGKMFNSVNKPFAQWDSATLSDWLQSLGLGMYSAECKKNVKNGEQLLKANSSDFDKELGMKNPLHRKKLLLAVVGAKGNELEPHQKIDYHWVVRWLDDIGLPQYKDAFFDARVDGSVLHYMTVEDLFHLKVTNQLHHISIKRGIQVLRENSFNPQCLKRRYLPSDEDSPKEVSKWTNHRVMEWLRTADLSEYAPNLRGSGVHGGLMVYEPRFNAELLATLLNIPPNKTLLRRHLCTQFKQLVGAELMQIKRECEAQTSYVPLSPSAKVKVIRKGQISLIRKRNKAETDFDDYVCPMNLPHSFLSDFSSIKKDPVTKERQEEKFLMKESNIYDNSTSEELFDDFSILNDLLRNEKALENMASTNV